MSRLRIVLGALALLCVVASNVLQYAVKAAIRREGYPVSWFSHPGMHSDFANLRKIIAAADSPEKATLYRKWQRRLVLSYVLFGSGALMFLGLWISMAVDG